MSPADFKKSSSSSTTAAWRLHGLVHQVMMISGICSASLPLVYYLVCRYFLQVERATCQRRDSTLMIILGGIFLTTSLAKYILLRPAVAQMHSVSEC
ncbi:hypothetical protein ASPSYDRAFT_49043 [Aspergillus sydowii CBS 593.65]|uniref:Uncharacterized protein n=1 Tax=Aspergillus sydowii CBS 593.65 TaxID=1036612 RepID=A0A1L9T609_9EURO|nr:uncharacterized protein ASPSYDRAFT_49043 [Aspergillus sydowii CBS 593.65]OJJ54882.1 hypothetical protein ASPSYDRAFT_49043 [Aspergillus sydowii CBS 593.65]